jgi:trans-2,3-dihydro-3-hydroxyanthranilate isomerase
VLEAAGLDAASMQAIAREFGHPETVFMLAAGEREHRTRIRIFTPMRELPFAGHPTVGTAVLLGLRNGNVAGSTLVLEQAIGAVRCTFESGSGTAGSASFAIPHLPRRSGETADDAAIAAALGLEQDEIGFGGYRPARWSAGLPATLVPVAGLTAIARCRPDLARFAAAFGDGPAYVFCGTSVDPGHDFHARMFAPNLGVAEDPATGSAAAAFAGLYSEAGGLSNGVHALVIEQGYEMGRPSVIRLVLHIDAGSLVAASVGGGAVIVTEGTIEA